MAAQIDSAVVRAWADIYLEGVDPSMAAERRGELASDVYEQRLWAHAQGAALWRTRFAVAARTVRGAPADLVWRRSVLRAAVSAGGPIASLTLTAAMLAAALGGFGLSVFAVTGTLVDGLAASTGLYYATAGGGLLLCAARMLLRSKQRFVAVGWLAVGGVLCVENAPPLISPFWLILTGSSFAGWDRVLIGYLLQQLVAIVVVLLCAAAAVAWWPARPVEARR